MVSDKLTKGDKEKEQGLTEPLQNPHSSDPLKDYVFHVIQTDVFVKYITVQALSAEGAQSELDLRLREQDLSTEHNTLESSEKVSCLIPNI